MEYVKKKKKKKKKKNKKIELIKRYIFIEI